MNNASDANYRAGIDEDKAEAELFPTYADRGFCRRCTTCDSFRRISAAFALCGEAQAV